jgi:hypothetical protein
MGKPGSLAAGYLCSVSIVLVLCANIMPFAAYQIRSSHRSCPATFRCTPSGCFLRAFLVTISSSGKVMHNTQYHPEFLVNPARITSALTITRRTSNIPLTGTVSLFLVITIQLEMSIKR